MSLTRPLPMFPLQTVLLPGAILPLHVFEERYRALVADCLASEEPAFGVVLISRGSEVGGGDERVGVGTLARIVGARPFDDGRWVLVAQGAHRIRVVSWLDGAPYPKASVEDDPGPSVTLSTEELDRARTAVARARTLLSELGADTASPGIGADTASRRIGDGIAQGSESHGSSERGGEDPDELLWGLCGLAPVAVLDRQRLLEAPHSRARLELLCAMCDELGDEVAGFLGGRS